MSREPSAAPVSRDAKRVAVILAGGFDPAGDTPLADAETPALDRMARIGRPGVVDLGAASPWDGFVSLLGAVDGGPSLGAAEALGLGVALAPGECAYRADFVTIADRGLRDPCGGKVKDPEASTLLDAVRAAAPSVRLVRAGGHRNLAILAGPAQFCPSPWEMVGRKPVSGLPAEGALRELYGAAEGVLAGHDVNAVRVDLRENPANALWFHGGGPAVTARPGAAPGCALVGRGAATEGLAAALGWRAVLVAGDDDALAAAALGAMAESQVVVVRTESVLEAAALGGAAGKRDALSLADARLVAPLLAACEEQDAFVMAVAADALLAADTHALVRRAVPFVVAGTGESAGLTKFDENAAAAGGFHLASGAEFAALWR